MLKINEVVLNACCACASTETRQQPQSVKVCVCVCICSLLPACVSVCSNGFQLFYTEMFCFWGFSAAATPSYQAFVLLNYA